MAAPARIRMITNSNSLSRDPASAVADVPGPVAKSILQHMPVLEAGQNIGLAIIAEVETG